MVFAVVLLLMAGPRPAGVAGAVDVSALPWVNAALNSVTMLVLVAGFAAIKTGRVALHRALMTSALGLSALFLASYTTYHLFVVGHAEYVGAFRAGYLFILVTHILLAIVILPLALHTWVRGFTGAITSHRRIAPVTLALWLYVAATGVLIVVLAHS